MANHALPRPRTSWLSLLTPSALRKLHKYDKLGVAVDLIMFTGVLGALLLLADGWLFGVAWMVINLGMIVVRVIVAGLDRIEHERLEERNQDVMEALASNPGGAPLMADVRSHCGCVLRYAYQSKDVLWTPVGVIHSSDSCLAEAR